MKILFIGDIYGAPGRETVKRLLPEIKQKYQIDFTIANGENATHGKGLSLEHYKELLSFGIDAITLGNHYLDKRDILNWIDAADKLVRPYNVHATVGGVGTRVFEKNGKTIRITNLLGRVYMNGADKNPFDSLMNIISTDEADIHIIDFHAEATGEKLSLAHAFDGQVTAVIGTHTHVQTNDARLLNEGGTAYMSDVGMTGPFNGIIGADPKNVIALTWTLTPARFEVEQGREKVFSAVILDIDNDSNKVQDIETIYKVIEFE